MTDYIEITDAETDPGAPGTSELWKKWWQNPIAMAEGAVGAPKINGKALTNIFLGNASATSTASPYSFLSIGNFDEIMLSGSSGIVVGNALQVSFSSDGGTVWGAWQSLIVDKTFSGNIVLSKSDGQGYVAGSVFTAPSTLAPYNLTQTLTIPADSDSFRLRASSAGSGVLFSYNAFIISGS